MTPGPASFAHGDVSLLILGTSGLAREMRELAATHLGFSDVELVPPETEEASMTRHRGPAALGIGYPRLRRSVHARWAAHSAVAWPVLRHPASEVATTAVVGMGAVLTFGVFVSTDVTIGTGALLNWNCSVGHDAVVGDYCVINPGATIGGHVAIGAGVLVGAGANVLEGLSIGEGATIGAGAVVTKDVPAGHVVAGVPARRLRP